MSLSFLLPMVMMLLSCGKDKNTTPSTSAPTNLSVSANVNPDNSGNVTFTASATNATTYEYGYGNGIYQTIPSGLVTYKYSTSGTYTINVTAKNSSGKTVSKSISITISVVASLIWSDEFNTDGAPDPAKWGYDIGAGGWGNNELEYYTNRLDNSIVQGGVLKIKAIKENYSGSNYTSARLLSKGKFSFKAL